MLVGKSLPEYVIIRIAIAALRLITPICILYFILSLIFQPHHLFRRGWWLAVEIWMLSEVLFYVLCYLPLKKWLQTEAVHPEPLTISDRRKLFQRCLDSMVEAEDFLSKWFLGAPIEQVQRENVKEFFAWSLMNVRYEDVNEEESAELDDYADGVEAKLQRKLQSGRGSAQCLRVSLDPVHMQHRPLIWYIVIFLVDCLSSVRLLYHRYRFYRWPLAKALTVFPLRPLSVLSRNISPAKQTTYWLRPHTSKTHLPMVMIQGIGVGLHAYVDFLIALSRDEDASQTDGEIGIMVVEIMAISARICPAALTTIEMLDDIRMMLDAHRWDEIVLVGHSYGTAIAATMLRDASLSKRVNAVMLMDPICFLLHLPDVAYNFTRRKPIEANEYMLHYFSSQDMMISHTLARHFFWSEYILWREDLDALKLPLTVTLSGQDLIVPTRSVWRYLTEAGGASDEAATSGTSAQPYTGDMEYESGLTKVLWFNDFDHASLLSSKGATRGVADAARQYCLLERSDE